MACIVQKYGGSSIADIEKLNKVADMVAAVKRQGFDTAVVVSAMGKTTNQLIELARAISSDPPRREMDMLLSTGERTSMALLCIALHERGIDAVSLTGSQCGIITNARHTEARVIEVRPFRVQDEMAAGRVVVIGGFQGVSYNRDITTLGRGGSDTTAVALAAALGADRCEIYSDVDGVYTADPAIVKDAGHLPEISYQVMQEMSMAGAKVLNAEAVQFAKEKQIAIYARSTFSDKRETVIRRLAPGLAFGVQAVVSENDIVRVGIQGDDTFGLLKQVLAFLEREQVPVKELNFTDAYSGETRASFVVSSKNVYNWEKVKQKLCDSCRASIHFESRCAALSLIGEGINQNNTTLLETIDLLAANGIPIHSITTTSFRISLLIPLEHIQRGVRLCHEKWISMHR